MHTLVNIRTKVHLTRGIQFTHSSGPVKSGHVKSLADRSCITVYCGRVLRQSVVHCNKGLMPSVENGSIGHEDAGSLVGFNNPNYLGGMFSLSSPR